jgi:hypothetical protein
MSTIQRPAWAKSNTVYWAVFTRHPGAPIVHGSHWNVRVDAPELDGGHVFTSEDGALAFLATLPTHYDGNYPGQQGRAIGWELGRVLYGGSGNFYDVVATPLEDLRPGMRVNVGTIGGGDYWQTIASIEPRGRVGGQWRGADVYAITWRDVVAEDPNAAPSLHSSRRAYDVVRTSY